MKKQKLRLNLNKETISKLNDMNNIKGGENTLQCTETLDWHCRTVRELTGCRGCPPEPTMATGQTACGVC